MRQERKMLEAYLKTVNSIAVSLNGTIVDSSSCDGIVKLWEVQVGKERQTFDIGSVVRKTFIISN